MKKLFSIITAAVMSASLVSCSFEKKEEMPPQPSEAVEIENNIRLGVTNVDVYNPITTESETVRDVCGFIFEPLFSLDGSMILNAVLAQDYEYNADGRGMTIMLKQGVTWHDGSEFTAQDVIYTINRIKAEGGVYGDTAKLINAVSSRDAYTVDISFVRAVPQAAQLMVFPIIKNGSMSGEFSVVGTGPYYKDGSSLKAYEQYHSQRAGIDEIIIVDIPDVDKYLSMFNASAIDIADSALIDMTNFMPKSNATVHDFTSNRMVFAGFNLRRQVFANVSARQAVSRIIDRDSIVTHIYYSRAKASEYAINPSSWLCFDTRSRLRSDAAQAAEYLHSGGWKLGENGVYTLQSEQGTINFDVKILVNSESEQRMKIAEQIADSMNAIGMHAELVSCTELQFNQRIAAMNYDMFIGETELLPNNDLTQLVSAAEGCFGYADNQTDLLTAQLGTVKDEESVKQVSIELYQHLFDDMPFAPICFMKKSLISSAKLKYGVAPSVSGIVRNTEGWGVK